MVTQILEGCLGEACTRSEQNRTKNKEVAKMENYVKIKCVSDQGIVNRASRKRELP